MTFATTALFKPTGCLSSHPTLLTTKASHPFLSLPSKPSKLHFSSPYSSLSWLSPLKSKISSSSVVSLIAQTSNFAQQNEETQVEELGINLESEETEEAHLSDLEGEEGEESGEESYSEPSEEAKLFVGNLHYEIDSEKLAQLLEQAGVVEIAEVIYNRETDRSRGFGFVTMSTVEEAEKAVEMFNGYDLNGRLLTVNKASPRGSRPERPPQTVEPLRIYIGNLPWQVDDDRLEQIFTEHGKVVDAKIVYDRETGRSRGFGFVTMSTLAEVDDAVAALDGQSLDGRAIRVNVAEKPRRNSF